MRSPDSIVTSTTVRLRLQRLRLDPRVQAAIEFFRRNVEEIEEEQVRITRIPAPPFEEAERADHFLRRLTDSGFDATRDAIGNVIAIFEESGSDPLVVGAHLDTVFPRDTPLELDRRPPVLRLPGITDNGTGLVAGIWLFRAAREAGMEFERPLLLVGNVGEEGVGNLRGIRHLFENPPWSGDSCEFVALDGAGLQRITVCGLGSRRFRVRMTGPGGHSWADFPRPNPIDALAVAIQDLNLALRDPPPGTTHNVGVIHGGISVNAIPSEAYMEVDLRATSETNLDDMERCFRSAATRAAERVGVTCDIEVIGRRPSGETSPGAGLVQTAVEATRLCGVAPILDIGSTDANVPMSLGIPALSIGGGGSGGNIHSLEEWFDPTGRHVGLERLLLLVAVLAGLKAA